MDEVAGRAFRDAWIKGVRAHFPGVPKDGYVSPWEAMPEWEQRSAVAVFEQIRDFIASTDGSASSLSRVQKGQFVAVCWAAQIFKHIREPKASYVADWSELPEWQRETDADIFHAVEAFVAA